MTSTVGDEPPAAAEDVLGPDAGTVTVNGCGEAPPAPEPGKVTVAG